MEQAIKMVDNLDKVTAKLLLEKLADRVLENADFEAITNHLPEALEAKGISKLLHLEEKEMEHQLDTDGSLILTKAILQQFASSPSLASILMETYDEVKKDDSLFITEIVTVGILANITLFLAATEMEFKIGKTTIKKNTYSPDLVKAVLNPLLDYVKAFGDAVKSIKK